MKLSRLIAAIGLAAATTVGAEDLVTCSGIRYRDIDVIETTTLGIKFNSEGKTHWVAFKDLPAAVAEHYGLDRKKAAAWEKKMAAEGDSALVFPDEIIRAETLATGIDRDAEVILLDNGCGGVAIYDQGYFYAPLPWWSYRDGRFLLTEGHRRGAWRWEAGSGYRCGGEYCPFPEFGLTSGTAAARLQLDRERRRSVGWPVKTAPESEARHESGPVAESRDRLAVSLQLAEEASIRTRAKLAGGEIDFEKRAVLIEESKDNRNMRFREVKRELVPKLLNSEKFGGKRAKDAGK